LRIDNEEEEQHSISPPWQGGDKGVVFNNIKIENEEDVSVILNEAKNRSEAETGEANPGNPGDNDTFSQSPALAKFDLVGMDLEVGYLNSTVIVRVTHRVTGLLSFNAGVKKDFKTAQATIFSNISDSDNSKWHVDGHPFLQIRTLTVNFALKLARCPSNLILFCISVMSINGSLSTEFVSFMSGSG